MNDRSRLVRGKLVMQLPRVVFGLTGWFAVGVLLPPVPAWILLTVLVAGGVACLLPQRMMARLLWWAWRMGPRYDQTSVLVTSRRLRQIVVAGPRALVVPRHLMTAGTPLAYARTLQRVAATRWDVLVAWLAWPWDRTATAAGWVARRIATLPLVRWAWSIRWVVAGIAVIQSAAAGRYVSSGNITVVIGLSYWMPWWRIRWQRAAHAAASGLTAAADGARSAPVTMDYSSRPAPAGRRHHHPLEPPSQRWHDRHQQIARHLRLQSHP